MKAEQIIYEKLRFVWAHEPLMTEPKLQFLARCAVKEIREEFRKAGVDVWPAKGGET